MARLAVIFTVISLLFTISHARFIQVHDVTADETVNDLPESDPEKATAILLPSERPGFEPAKVVDFKHDDASETDSDVDSMPLTTVSFRPINRHFHRRPMFPFRHKHNCRLHKRFRSLNPRFQQKRYISYGDDMILSDENSHVDPESRGFVRQIQARWARFPEDGVESKEARGFIKAHHHEHEEEHDHDEDHYHHEHEEEHDHDDDHHHHEHDHDHDEHHHHHHGEEDENDDKEEHEQDYLHGYIKSFRKFFGLF
ncbi:hypothetical protein COLO4_10683 [Corchorus olitorius]|uniref:Uncharacterized protein n=1 Tax=Corchorus olitorius TaxID=93759 RepID=A0A1R3K7E1_9ROSI|nr:hypothetical protein COLO4_10683 [Corchorus olitorius]